MRFESAEEKAAVQTEAKRIAERLAQNFAQQQKLDAGEVQPEARNYTFGSLPQTVKERLIGTIVKGEYDKDGLLQGNMKHKQPVLNEIQRVTMMNGTYLQEGNRLLKKVQSLLPTLPSARQGNAGQQAKRTR